MRICVFGAGAVGGYLAVRLARTGTRVSIVARGAHLQAIRRDGLTLRSAGTVEVVHLEASDRSTDLGPQDVVFCTLKAHQAYASAPDIAALCAPHTSVVVAMNGLPWWYFHRYGGDLEGTHLDAVDPQGRQWHAIGPERAIGCVVEPACALVAPGVVEHHRYTRFLLGEPAGGTSRRVEELSRLLAAAGLDAPVRDPIRWNVWLKLLGNICLNPLGLLTCASVDRIVHSPELGPLCVTMMREARAVAAALGVDIPHAMIDRRLAAVGSITGHRISMLQDLERGRSLELDAIVTAVQELGRRLQVATPVIDAIAALARARGLSAGLYAPLPAAGP